MGAHVYPVCAGLGASSHYPRHKLPSLWHGKEGQTAATHLAEKREANTARPWPLSPATGDYAIETAEGEARRSPEQLSILGVLIRSSCWSKANKCHIFSSTASPTHERVAL